MKKNKLKASVIKRRNETKDALQTVYDAMNNGQQKKILKNKQVKALFDFYGVNY